MNEGLSQAEVTKRRQKFGKNVLEVENPNTWWRMLLNQFTDLMVILLMISAFIAIGFGLYEGNTHGLYDGYVILGIVILNAAIGFFQEFKTEKALEALKKLVAPHAIVIRDGKKEQIKAENIVPGDVVVLQAGDKIVADGVMLEATEVKIDESALTGESVPVHRKTQAEVFMGTTIVAGVGKMEVTKTGMQTQFGRIAHLTTETRQDSSPLQKELYHIGVFVTKVTLSISGLLILTGVFLQGQRFIDALLFSVSVAVAAVPEGLPATITVALALGVQKMVKKQAVVKRLSSIETLGSTTVICSDKTGTLTKNEMTVTRLLLGDNGMREVSGTGYDPKKGKIEKLSGKESQNLDRLRLISHYCTEADLQKKGKRYKILGDPTEGALLTLAQKKVNGNKMPRIKKLKILEEIPFDSTRKLMSVAVKNGSKRELFTKGSPDELLKRCKTILLNGKTVKLSAKMRKSISAHYQEMADDALRVIAFGYRPLKKKVAENQWHAQEKDLTFVGLAGMIDPARDEVGPAVKLCHKAGIRTIIITGDYGLTAKAIAKQVGIANGHTEVILGEELDKMSDRKLDKLLKKPKKVEKMQDISLIFSRVNPEHKRRIVDRLKKMGEVVAVTGDGVNDAPALKRADLGIAMGITGTEVSKETANMILLDDSFASIVTAVQEGRKIYANLRKFTWFIFSCNIGELVTVFSAIIFQVPAPLTASLILAIDLGTDILPGIALGIDHEEPDVMDKPPRDQKQRIMSRDFVTHFVAMGIFIGTIVVGIYWWELYRQGWSWGQELEAFDPIQVRASTFAFAALVVIQLFNAFNARSFEHSVFKLKTLWQLWGATAVSVVLVGLIVYMPFFQTIFKTTALDGVEWAVVMGCGVLVLFVEEFRKWAMKRF